jgi:membrane protein YdbS with pleckstrin-like domain
MAWTGRSRSNRAVSLLAGLLLVWLLIGAVAAGQRGYFSGSSTNCAKVSTTVVTILAGPLNYVGANPKIDCEVPQPSR